LKLKRYFKVVNLIIIIAIMLSFSSCEFSPVDSTDLVRPPKLTGEQQSLQAVLEKQIGTKYLLKYPIKGPIQNRTAFIERDIDGDGQKEAFALYQPQNENAGTHIMVFKKTKDVWNKICDISGDGNEIESIDFGDYYGKGDYFLTVGWTLFNNSNYKLGVYNIGVGKGGYTKVYSDSFSEMAIVNIDNNSTDDMLLFNLDPVTKLSKARMITYKDDRLQDVSDAPLDSTVSSYADVYVTNIGNYSKGVLLDGYKGAHSMVTELITWKDGALCTPFYDTKQNAVTSTLRDVTIDCADIDNDGTIEIPLPVEMPGFEDKKYEEKIWLIRWYESDNLITPRLSCIMNSSEGYYFVVPSKWVTPPSLAINVTVHNDSAARTWIFKQWDKTSQKDGRELFEIQVYSQAEWKTVKNRAQLEVLSQINDNIYVVKLAPKLEQNDPLYLQFSEIQRGFKLIS